MWRGRDSLTIVAIALLALSLVLGHHIHIGENPDNGTIAENFIEPYSWFDAVAYVCILYVLILMARAITQITIDYRLKNNPRSCGKSLIYSLQAFLCYFIRYCGSLAPLPFSILAGLNFWGYVKFSQSDIRRAVV